MRIRPSTLDEGAAARRSSLHATDDGLPLYEQAGFIPDARWMGTPIGALR